MFDLCDVTMPKSVEHNFSFNLFDLRGLRDQLIYFELNVH